MTHSTLISLSRRALQLAALFAAVTSVTFGGEPVTSNCEEQLIGRMVVTATRERPLIAHLVVTSGRLAPANVAIADLGAMTVTARRDTALARNKTPRVVQASL